jgi:hypothetical protein
MLQEIIHRARIFLLFAACAFASMAVVRADPPTSVSPDTAAPPIATVTLRPLAPSENGIAPPLDPGRGIRFEDLPRDVGLRVRVLTRNQRVHLGWSSEPTRAISRCRCGNTAAARPMC